MMIQDLIKNVPEIKTLRIGNTIKEARELFIDQALVQLPIVEKRKFIGTLSFEIIASEAEDEKIVGAFSDDFITVFINENHHPINILDIISENELLTLPIVNDEMILIGAIPINDFLKAFYENFSFHAPGGIFTLHVGTNDFDLSEIVRIIESNNAKVTTLLNHWDQRTDKLNITIKVDKLELRHIEATFQRFEYDITVHQAYDSKSNELQDRYNHLMKYLNI